MSFEIKLVPELSFLELIVQGEVDYDELVQMKQEVNKFIEDKNIQYALVDVRKIIWKASTTNIFEFATQADRHNNVRAAIVCRPDDDNAQFFETVALNRGKLENFFTDYDEARNYLIQSTEKTP